jgi:hypothetical protein
LPRKEIGWSRRGKVDAFAHTAYMDVSPYGRLRAARMNEE